MSLNEVTRSSFSLPECEGKDSISFGIPTEAIDQVGRIEVVTRRYEDEGYLNGIKGVILPASPEDLVNSSFDYFEESLPESLIEEFENHGLLVSFRKSGYEDKKLYIDRYTWSSVPFVAISPDGYTGSARLIKKNGTTPLPTLSAPEIRIWDKHKDEANTLQAEMSQVAKTRNSHPGTLLGLLRSSRVYSRSNDIEKWIATIDKRVFRLLKRMCFDIEQIGEEVDYLGSTSIPAIIDVTNSIESVRKHSSPEVARFLDGEKDVPGFGWYKGV